MKGCFILQRRFAQIGHEVAVLLKEQGVVDEFCAYVHARDSFDMLKSQVDIPYTSLILDEDIQKKYKDVTLNTEFLRTFETEYSYLWKYIGADRVVRYGQFVREYPHDTSPYSYEDMLKIVQIYIQELSAFLDREKPDFIFAYQPGSLGFVLFYDLAKKRGIPILTTVIPNTHNRVVLSQRHDRLTWVDEIFKKNAAKPPAEVPHYDEAARFIKEFREKPTVYSKVYSSILPKKVRGRTSALLPNSILRTAQFIFRMTVQWWRDAKRRSDYTSIHPFYFFVDTIRRKLRSVRTLSNLYDTFDRKEEYVYYPLHLEPELAILVMAPFDTDQRAIIKRLAQSLPVGMYVYVKEHPAMVPYRPRSFYEDLKKIPNVRLLPPETSSFELIKGSRIVTTIAGSPGWEALFLGKPVITFGEVFYNALSSVRRSRVPEELPEIVSDILSRENSTDEEITRYLAALFEDSAKCDLYYLWEKEDSGVNKREELVDFAKLTAKKIKLVTQ